MYTDKVGDKVDVSGIVIKQRSTPKPTPIGLVYSHYHLIRDDSGRLFQYKGSSLFRIGTHVNLNATIKGYTQFRYWSDCVTVIKAPKLNSQTVNQGGYHEKSQVKPARGSQGELFAYPLS